MRRTRLTLVIAGWCAAGLVAADRAAGAEPWFRLSSTQWKSDSQSVQLAAQGATVLPAGARIAVFLRFGDELVNQSVVLAGANGDVAISLAGLSARLPAGQYTLTAEARLREQDGGVAKQWAQVFGLKSSMESSFQVALGEAQDEEAGRTTEIQEWREWFKAAETTSTELFRAIGGSAATGESFLAASPGIREQLAALRQFPRPFALTYIRGLKETATRWLASAEESLRKCDRHCAEKKALPPQHEAMAWRLQQEFEGLAQLLPAAGPEGGGPGRIGGLFSHAELKFELKCALPGWAWVRQAGDDMVACLENPAPTWADCRIEIHARRRAEANEEKLKEYVDKLLLRWGNCRTTMLEPPFPPTAQIALGHGRQFFYESNGRQGCGWTRAVVTRDGRLLALVAAGPARTWAEFKNLAQSVFESVQLQTVE